MAAGPRPVLWGAGVDSCAQYARTWNEAQTGSEPAMLDISRYREWLMGLVSGLSVSTGLDLLHATEPAGALRRIAQICDEEPATDFYNAAMRMFGQMSIPGAGAEMFPNDRAATPLPENTVQSTLEQPFPPTAQLVPREPRVMNLQDNPPRVATDTASSQSETPPSETEDSKSQPTTEANRAGTDSAVDGCGNGYQSIASNASCSGGSK